MILKSNSDHFLNFIQSVSSGPLIKIITFLAHPFLHLGSFIISKNIANNANFSSVKSTSIASHTIDFLKK